VNKQTAENIFQHLVGAIMAGEGRGRPFVGSDAPPWHVLLLRVSRAFADATASAARALMHRVCEKSAEMTEEQYVAYNAIGRSLFEFADAQNPVRQNLVNSALRFITCTFPGAPEESAEILRRCLTPERLAERGYSEMFWVTSNVELIIPVDPELAEDIYRSVFSHRETSTEGVAMGGQILALVSNRKQDYEHAYYQLGEAFPAFLEHAPIQAFSALVSVLELVTEQDRLTHQRGPDQEYRWDAGVGRLSDAHSYLWDEGPYRQHEPPVKMLNQLETFLDSAAQDGSKRDLLAGIVDIAVKRNRLSTVWRRLLRVGAKHPQSLGMQLAPACRSTAFLTSADTSRLVGELLQGVFPLLSEGQRRQIEEITCGIEAPSDDQRTEWAERTRDLLLRCLDAASLVTEEARALVAALPTQDDVLAGGPPLDVEEARDATDWWRENLARSGVPVDDPAHVELMASTELAESFRTEHLNEAPAPEAARDAVADLQRLLTLVTNAVTNGICEQVAEAGLLALTRAAVCIARIPDLDTHPDLHEFAATVILTASRSPLPVQTEEGAEDFDARRGGIEPSIRDTAGDGLIALAQRPGCATVDMLEAVEQAAQDEVPGVRWHIARNINVLYNTDRERMWRIIRRMVADEQSRVVLMALVDGPLHRLKYAHPDEITEMATVLYSRALEGPESDDLRQGLVSIFLRLFIWRDHPACSSFVDGVLDDIPGRTADAIVFAHLQRDMLAIGSADAATPEQDLARSRSLQLSLRLIREAGPRLVEAHRRMCNSQEPPPESETDVYTGLARAVDALAENVYHGGGAYEISRPPGENDDETRDESCARLRRFYVEGAGLIDELVQVGIPKIAHHVVETLEQCIPFDPKGVFVRVATALTSGEQCGYQHESLGIDLFVRIVHRYLAEHRDLFAEDDECRRLLMECIDIFVRAGWPAALQLVYRLDEIYR